LSPNEWTWIPAAVTWRWKDIDREGLDIDKRVVVEGLFDAAPVVRLGDHRRLAQNESAAIQSPPQLRRESAR
jgi:hypothetical protein